MKISPVCRMFVTV